DPADAAGCVQSGKRVAFTRLRNISRGAQQDAAWLWRGAEERPAHVVVGKAGERLPDGVGGDLAQPGVGIAAVVAELAIEELFDVGAVPGCQPALLYEQVGQWSGLPSAPQGTGPDELVLVNQVGLQGEHTEKEVAVGARRGRGHGTNPRTETGKDSDA